VIALRLAARFARSSGLATSVSIVFSAAAFLLAMFIVLHTLTLSGSQIADRDLGRFGASVGYGALVARPGDRTVDARLARAAHAAGATGAVVSLTATDVQLSGTASAGPREVTLQEMPWASRPFPQRYALLAGRWPRRAGEVVLTDPADVSGSPGTSLPAFGGRTRFRVVGSADDRYARTSALLAAPGTWGTLDQGLAKRFPLLQAQAALYWSGNAPARVSAAVSSVAEAGPGAVSVGDTLVTREQLASAREPTWISRTPAGYTIPSLLLPFAAVALVFGLQDRRFRRNLRVLARLGVQRSLGVASLTLATTAWCLLALMAGALAGVVLGLGAKELIAHLRGVPTGPIAGLAAPLLRLVGAVALAAVCAGLVLSVRAEVPDGSPTGSSTRSKRAARLKAGRHLLALAAWCLTVRVALQVDSPARAMVLAGVLTLAVLLLVPELVALLLRNLPEVGPRTRLSRRQLAADRHRVAAAITLLAVILGGSLGYLTLLETLVRTKDEQGYPDVLPGQVLVADRSSPLLPPSPEVLRTVAASSMARVRPALELRYLHELDGAGNAKRSVSVEGAVESIVALDSINQVERLVSHRFTSHQAAVLREGGILRWADGAATPAGGGAGVRLAVTADDRRTRPSIEVPAASVECEPAGWRAGTSGVLLTATARRLRLPVTGGATMYTGVPDSQAREVQQSIVRAGLDARTIQLYQRPPPAVPPAALGATAAGLVVIALLASLLASRGQVRTLRGYLGRLISIGVPTRWARQVLLYQQVVIVLVATVLALFIAIPPAIVATMRISGFVMSVPATQILILVASVYAATCLAALEASRRLRARGDSYEP